MVVELVSVKIHRDAYIDMMKIKGAMQAESGENWTMADVIDLLLDEWPKKTIVFDPDLFGLSRGKK